MRSDFEDVKAKLVEKLSEMIRASPHVDNFRVTNMRSIYEERQRSVATGYSGEYESFTKGPLNRKRGGSTIQIESNKKRSIRLDELFPSIAEYHTSKADAGTGMDSTFHSEERKSPYPRARTRMGLTNIETDHQIRGEF